MHLVHIIPRMQLAAVYGAPPVDFLPQQDPVAYEQLVAEAERFVAARFLTLLQGLQPEPVAHIIKVRKEQRSDQLLRLLPLSWAQRKVVA